MLILIYLLNDEAKGYGMVSVAKTGVQRRAERIVSHEGARPGNWVCGEWVDVRMDCGRKQNPIGGIAPKKKSHC